MNGLEALFAPAFTVGGVPTSWLELVAVVLSIAMVVCNIREIHWGWPLAIVASLMYFAIFWRAKTYGVASLQVFFALVAVWGWWQWLRGRADDGRALHVQKLGPRGLLLVVVASALFWLATGWFLQTHTDSGVAWWDAFPTGLSIVGQFLLGRKYVENWIVWIVVNVVSVGLFAFQDLWLTAGLYGLFIALAIVGWRQWRARL